MLEPKYRLLKAFMQAPSAEKYAKEIEGETEVTHERSLHYLDSLSKEGILLRKRKGKQVFFSLNRENPSTGKLLAILEFGRKADFLKITPYAPLAYRLLQKLKAYAGGPVAFVVLFGSAARKQAAKSSDVDVLIAVNRNGNIKRALAAEVKALEREFNYALSPTVMTIAELAKNWHKQPIYKSIWNDRVVLDGEEGFWNFIFSEGEP